MLTEAFLKRLQRIEPYTELWRDDQKFVELRVGLYATFFFRHVHPMVDSNVTVREALIGCWNDYWQVVGLQNQRWVYGFDAGVRGYRLPSSKVAPIDVLLRDPGNFGGYQYYVHGGKNEDDASEFLFDMGAFPINGAPEFPTELGYLRLQAPLAYVSNGRLSSFVQLAKRCAARLKVDQAHGGLGFLRTYNEESSTRFTEAQLSKVFSGIDIDVPHRQAANVFHWENGPLGIDSPHWLNFLSDRWVDELGGIKSLRAQLPREIFVVEPYEGGVFIQAGEYPEPGHRDDGLPPAYVWLNRVLRAVRAPEMVYCTGNEPGQLGRYQGAQAYFARFDAASDKLTNEEANLDGAFGVATSAAMSTERLRCEAGQPCPRGGWWFTPARANSRRRFSAGDVMPDVGGPYGATIWQWDES